MFEDIMASGMGADVTTTQETSTLACVGTQK
jgi:hypothetical protein